MRTSSMPMVVLRDVSCTYSTVAGMIGLLGRSTRLNTMPVPSLAGQKRSVDFFSGMDSDPGKGSRLFSKSADFCSWFLNGD